MTIRALYTTRCYGARGEQFVSPFASVEDAKNAPIPAGCEFALIPVGKGYHVYSRALGWEEFGSR